MSHPARGVSFATALSIGLHAVFASAVMSLPRALFEPSASGSVPIEVEIVDDEVTALDGERAPTETHPAERPETQPEVAEPPPARAITRAGASMLDALPTEPVEPADARAPHIEPSETASVSSVAASSAPPSPRPRDLGSPAMRAVLAPGAVARGGFVFEGPGPSRPGPPAGNSRGGPRPLSEAEAEQRHNDHLRSQAMSKAHIEREPFVIRRQRDGSYRHEGHVFVGIVRPDGEVEFHDSGAVQSQGLSSTFEFDPTGLAMQAAGQDPHRAERARFMRETEQLRLRLEREHRARQLAASSRQQRGRLRRLWGVDTNTHAERRAQLFGVWDALAEDGSADSLRRGVLRFIRGNLPEGHERAYRPDELSRLNARRESRAEFAPY